MSDFKIAVVGAGIVGLSTALELQKEFRGAEITLISNEFYKNTTSYVAAGLFRPSSFFSGPTEQITREWIQDSYDHWDNVRISQHASLAGVTQLSGYIFSNISPDYVRNQHIEKIVPIYRTVTEDELSLCNNKYKYGSFLTTILIESGLHLPWATNKLLDSGNKIVKQKIDSLSKIGSQYDIVVNCTGIGAKFLCNDRKLVPIRGQVLKVYAPWVKMFMYSDYDTYIIPGFEAVTLGGIRQFDNYDLKPCKHDSAKIRKNCEALLPSLKAAPLLEERVGLRPHRDIVRVEKDKLNYNGKVVKIVHNYGHGGYGVTTAPGTAKYAVKLVKESLSGNSKL